MTKLQLLCKHVCLPLYQTYNKQQRDELKSNNCKITTTRDCNIFILPLKDFQAVPFLVFPVQVMRGSLYVSFNLMAVECNSQRSKFDRFRDKAPLGFHTIEVFLTSDPDCN